MVIREEYESVLQGLLQQELLYRQQILLHTALAVFGLCYMDDQKTCRHKEALRALPHEHFAEFSLNPLLLLESLYSYYKFNEIKQESLEELYLLSEFSDRHITLTHKPLIFLAGYIILMIHDDQATTSAFIETVGKYKMIGIQSSDFRVFLHHAKAYQYLLTE